MSVMVRLLEFYHQNAIIIPNRLAKYWSRSVWLQKSNGCFNSRKYGIFCWEYKV
jgi:hypothetical protein